MEDEVKSEPTENELDALEAEFHEVREDLKEMLFEIREYLMEALSPIPNDLDRERLREELETARR
jgi:uncharacterized protein YicC (UPF0701 family)